MLTLTPVELLNTTAVVFVVAISVFTGYTIGKKQGAKKCDDLQVFANQSMGSYLATILHHLRTPLAGMMWSLKEMRKNTPEGSESSERITKLYEENVRLLGIVENLLASSRASSGRAVYNFETTNTSVVEQQILKGISEMSSSAYVKNISLRIETLPISNRGIRADEEKIISVVQTLFENAVRYTEPGGNIFVTTGEEQAYFVFRIADSGMGIPEDEKGKIFTQFFRAENARRKIPDGYGVGLFLAKTFVDAHNGTISFESNKGNQGHGTTFTVKLPLLPHD